MTEVEITNFAIELLTEPLEKEGYETPTDNWFLNFVRESGCQQL